MSVSSISVGYQGDWNARTAFRRPPSNLLVKPYTGFDACKGCTILGAPHGELLGILMQALREGWLKRPEVKRCKSSQAGFRCVSKKASVL